MCCRYELYFRDEETENLNELLKVAEWDELKILFLLDWGGLEEVSSYSEYFILASRGGA